MRSGKLIGIVVIVFYSLMLSVGSGFCAEPILACDPTLEDGIGAMSFIDGNGNLVAITSVTYVADDPAYCEVRGFREPLDLFVITLPDSWAGRYWQTGNGGAAGSLGNITPGISRGYVSVSGSGGHDNAVDGFPLFKVFYPPGDPDAEAKLDDFGSRSVHLTKLLALDMIKAYYGDDVAPTYSYYSSCSNGGRQGLIEAQRYEEDFDGLVLGAPANPYANGVQASVYEGQLLKTDPWEATGTSSMIPKLPILAAKVMEKCDGIDGLVDGLIDDPRKCDFSPMDDLPACAGDVDGVDCFTSNQRDIVEKFYLGPPGLWWDADYPRWTYGTEAMVPGPNGPTSNFAGMRIPTNLETFPPFGAPIGAMYLQWVGLPYSGNGGGEGWDWNDFSWTDGVVQETVAALTARMDAVDPDLRVFQDLGSKIIQYTGWADNSTTANATLKYYDLVNNFMGIAETQSFYKLYMVPGMAHCGGGTGCGSVDWQPYIEDWVENGVDPGTVIGYRAERGDPNDPSNYMTERTRPLCPFPQVARYMGTGSIDEADNFKCVETIKAEVRVEPETLNLRSRGKFTAFITLPEGYDVNELSAVTCQGALAVNGKLSRKGDTYVAKFNRQDLVNIAAGENVIFTVTAFFEQNGENLVLEGSDNVRVIK